MDADNLETTLNDLLNHLLRNCRTRKASDLHLSSGLAPMLRVDGVLERMELAPLSADTMQQLCKHLLKLSASTTEHDDHASETAFASTIARAADTASLHFQQQQSADFAFAYTLDDVSTRYRASAFMQQRGATLALRPIAVQAPTLEEVQAPTILAQLCNASSGLVLITGATGSGKSTTLAAMINHINQNRAAHIISIEDPIEFIHTPAMSLIQQREVGAHCPDFASALRASLRADPDVLYIGELRDLESIRQALTAAETGHLVFATLHSNSAPQAVDRIVDVFEPHEKSQIRTMLADSLLAVVTQELVAMETGRAAVHEVLVCTDAVRNLIRENKGAQLITCMQSGAAHGMQTMAQAKSLRGL